MKRRQRGSALVIVIVLAAIILALVVANLAEGRAAVQYSGQSSRHDQIHYAVQAGLAVFRDQITYPQLAGLPYTGFSGPSLPPYTGGNGLGYQGNNNIWLHTIVSSNGVNTWVPMFPPVASHPATGNAIPFTPTVVVPIPQHLRIPGQNVNGIPVWVWVNDVNLSANGTPVSGPAGNEYRLAAFAAAPSDYDSKTKLFTYDQELILQDLRENQPFSAYMFFTFSRSNPLMLGNISVSGSISSNDAIYFPTTGRAQISGTASVMNSTSSEGFFEGSTKYNPGSLPGNVTVGGTQVLSAPTPLPSTGVSGLQTNARAASNPPGTSPPLSSGGNFYNIAKGSTYTGWPSSGQAVNAEITVVNGSPPTLTITAQATNVTSGAPNAIGTGASTTYTNVPFPDSGVIYVDGNVTVNAPSGFSGGLTVVSGTGNVVVGSNINYQDPAPSNPNGTCEFVLYDPGSGTYYSPAGSGFSGNYQPIANAPANWSGLQYVENPAWSGPTSTLGLMAFNEVQTAVSGVNTPAASAPNNLTMNASSYAYQGSAFDASAFAGASTTGQNLAISGSLVGNNGVARTNTINGYKNAGLYAWDPNGSKKPPPGWLATLAPAFGAFHARPATQAPARYLFQANNLSGGSAGAQPSSLAGADN
jgi:hypothetical protein